MTRSIRIGTRGSPLALAQAHMVAAALRAAHNLREEQVQIVPILTSGDLIQDRPLAEVGGKALWTKELDRCLMQGKTDMSVHSMKDVETIRPGSLEIAAMLPRAEVCDRLIGCASVDLLPKGARVGTSSPRRRAQLLRRRPDLEIVGIRGNVQTRLLKVSKGEVDAIILAGAGSKRLGLEEVGTPVSDFIPAPAQGAVGVEIMAGADDVRMLVEKINHHPTHICVKAERRLLEGLNGNCRSPVAALARLSDNEIDLRAEIMTSDGEIAVAGATRFSPDDTDAPMRLAHHLLAQSPSQLKTLFSEEESYQIAPMMAGANHN